MNPYFQIPGFSVGADVVSAPRLKVLSRLQADLTVSPVRPSVTAQIFSRGGKTLLRTGLELEFIFISEQGGGFQVSINWPVDLPANDYLLRYSVNGRDRELPFYVSSMSPEAVTGGAAFLSYYGPPLRGLAGPPGPAANITEEAQARMVADSALQGAIDAETARALAAEALLQSNPSSPNGLETIQSLTIEDEQLVIVTNAGTFKIIANLEPPP